MYMVITKNTWLTKACWLKEYIQKAQVFNLQEANLLCTYKAGATESEMKEESGRQGWHWSSSAGPAIGESCDFKFYGLNVCVPTKKFICCSHTLQCNSIWKWKLWEVISFSSHEGWAHVMWLVPLKDEKETRAFSLSLPYEDIRKPSLDTWYADTLILDFQTSTTVKNI